MRKLNSLLLDMIVSVPSVCFGASEMHAITYILRFVRNWPMTNPFKKGLFLEAGKDSVNPVGITCCDTASSSWKYQTRQPA